MDDQQPQVVCADLLAEHLGEVIDKREESVWLILFCSFPQKTHCLHKLISHTYINTNTQRNTLLSSTFDSYKYNMTHLHQLLFDSYTTTCTCMNQIVRKKLSHCKVGGVREILYHAHRPGIQVAILSVI